MKTAPMIVMPRPTARRAPSSTTKIVRMPTQTSMLRGKIWLAIVSILMGSHAPTKILAAISVPSMAQPKGPRA